MDYYNESYMRTRLPEPEKSSESTSLRPNRRPRQHQPVQNQHLQQSDGDVPGGNVSEVNRDRALMPPPPRPQRPLSSIGPAMEQAQDLPSNEGGFRDMQGQPLSLAAPQNGFARRGEREDTPMEATEQQGSEQQCEIDPPFPELPAEFLEQQVVIRNWLRRIKAMGRSTVEARAALALMGLRKEADAVLDMQKRYEGKH